MSDYQPQSLPLPEVCPANDLGLASTDVDETVNVVPTRVIAKDAVKIAFAMVFIIFSFKIISLHTIGDGEAI